MAKIYCLFDVVAEESGPVFECRNDAMARRLFDTMKDENFPPGSSRVDFKLMKLGSFFHGDQFKKPMLYGLSQAMDITFSTNPVEDMEEMKDEAV